MRFGCLARLARMPHLGPWRGATGLLGASVRVVRYRKHGPRRPAAPLARIPLPERSASALAGR
jgi:hypothetical protein